MFVDWVTGSSIRRKANKEFIERSQRVAKLNKNKWKTEIDSSLDAKATKTSKRAQRTI